MSSIPQGGNPSQPLFSNLLNLVKPPQLPQPYEPIYPQIEPSPSDYGFEEMTYICDEDSFCDIGTPLPKQNDVYPSYPSPDYSTARPTHQPPAPAPSLFYAEAAASAHSPWVLSQDLMAQINALPPEAFTEADPNAIFQENDLIEPIILQMAQETSQRFLQEATLFACQQRLALCEQAISDIHWLATNLSNENKEYLATKFRSHMAEMLRLREAHNFNTFLRSHDQIPSYMEEIKRLLTSFKPNSSNPIDEAHSLPLHHYGVQTIVDFLQEESERLSIPALPLDQRGEAYNELITRIIQHFASQSPGTATTLTMPIRQAFADSLLEKYAESCRESFDKGTLKVSDLEQTIAILSSIDMWKHRADVASELIQKIFGTTDTEALKERVAAQAKTWQKEQLEQRAKLNFFERLFSKSAKRGVLSDEQNKIIHAQEEIITYLETIFTSSEVKSGIEIDDFFVIQPSEPADKPIVQDVSSADLPAQPVAPIPTPIPIIPLPKKPTASYVHIAFQELLARALGQDLYEQFPELVQKDIIRHLFNINLKGPAEEQVEGIFQKKIKYPHRQHINLFYIEELDRLKKRQVSQNSSDEAQLGEEILEIYYRGEQFSLQFIEKFEKFQPSNLFLHYMYQQAVEAKIAIPEGDYDWARHHYKNPHFVHLTMQALERELHTQQ